MYSAVPPPEKDSSLIKGKGANEKRDPPKGISQETWEKFQLLKERRIKCCQTSTEKRIKGLKNKVTKSVLDNLKSDEEIAVLRDYGVHCQVGKKCKQISSSHDPENRNKDTKEYEKRWRELQHYIQPDHHVLSLGMTDDQAGTPGPACTLKGEMEKSLDSAIEDGKFDKAEKLNQQLMQHEFVIKVAQAVECRDYAKRKAVAEEKTRKRKRSKPHWAFEQKARWESKGNM